MVLVLILPTDFQFFFQMQSVVSGVLFFPNLSLLIIQTVCFCLIETCVLKIYGIWFLFHFLPDLFFTELQFLLPSEKSVGEF